MSTYYVFPTDKGGGWAVCKDNSYAPIGTSRTAIGAQLIVGKDYIKQIKLPGLTPKRGAYGVGRTKRRR